MLVCRYVLPHCARLNFRLFNQIFPASPQHIPRVSLAAAGVSNSTNVTRFMNACQRVGLLEADIFDPSDMQAASETGIGRVAWTVIALARHAGRHNAAVRPQTPAASPSKPRSNARPLSVSSSFATTVTGDPSRRATSPPCTQSFEVSSRSSLGSRTRRMSAQSGASSRGSMVRCETPDADTARGHSFDDRTVSRTPTRTTFALSDIETLSPHRTRRPFPRSATQPMNPPGVPPRSQSINPIPAQSVGHLSRPPTAARRSTLLSKHTTDTEFPLAKDQAEQTSPPTTPTAERGGFSRKSSGPALHFRERTPSLISSGSRVTSAYTRSSVAMSLATIVGDDHEGAIDIVEDEDDPRSLPLNERRLSERTLHDARQRFLGNEVSARGALDDARTMVQQNEPKDELRDLAITQSLAALEGWRSGIHRAPLVASPRRTPSRPVSRSGEVGRVAEEDEYSLNGEPRTDPNRQTMIRRTSANGKVYVPKRSPSPRLSSGTNSPFSAIPQALSMTEAPMALLSVAATANPRPSIRPVRRQSDGLAYAASPVWQSSGRPRLYSRNESVVSLSAVDNPSAVSHESRRRNIQGQPLQILEIREPGLSPMRDVSEHSSYLSSAWY